MIYVRKYNEIPRYLYIVKKQYVRDRRKTIKKNKYKGDGSGWLQRGNYTKNEYEYAGIIVNRKPIISRYLTSFKEFLKNYKNRDWISFLINSEFEDILDKYIEYMCWILDIEEEELTDKKYFVFGNGYLGKKTIQELKNFIYQKHFSEEKPDKSIILRCIDCGIEDETIIQSLYNQIIKMQNGEGFGYDVMIKVIKEEINLFEIDKENQMKIKTSYGKFISNSNQ